MAQDEGATDASATDGTGTGVAAGTGSGAKARIPPSTSAAAATPATRPKTIERRAHIVAGMYQYERPGASGPGPR